MYHDNVSPVSELKKAKNIYETKLFRVSVPFISTMSSEEIKMYGVYQSGNRDIDRNSATEMINIMIPTKTILEYFKQGATIRLPKSSDIKEIYIVIQNYLDAWRNMLDNGINFIETPTEDLLELDSLAEDVFSRAKWYFNSNDVSSELSSFFNQVGRNNKYNFFNDSIKEVINSDKSNTTINPIDEDTGPERESLNDFFKRKIYSTRFRR